MVLPFPLVTCYKASAQGYQAQCLPLQNPQGLHCSMCPWGDIEVARGNTVGWNRFVTEDCHPELWTQPLPLGTHCLAIAVWTKEKWVH